MIEIIKSLKYEQLIWLIPFVNLLHQLEEWNILKWYKRNYQELPPATNLSIRLWLIVFCTFLFLWTLIAFIIPGKFVSSFMVLIITALLIQNGLQHIYWTVIFKQYSPGLIISVFFSFPVFIYFFYRISIEGILSVWVIIPALVLIITPGLIESIKAKDTLTKNIKDGLAIGYKLETTLSKNKS